MSNEKKTNAVMLREVRLSFPSLWKTEIYNGEDTGKYTATFLIPKDSDAVKEVKAAMKKVAVEKWGTTIPKTVKWCLDDGDEKEYDGYEGMYSVKSSTKKRPLIINRDKSAITEEDDVIYAGCYVNAKISFWAMDNQYGKRVLCNLEAIQYHSAGEAFGSSGASVDDFDDLSGEDSGTDADDFDDDIPF